LNLKKISLEAATSDAQGRRLRIQGFAQSGQGVINMDGFALLEPGFPVELSLIGEKFEAAKLPEAEVSVSPTLKIAFGHAQGNITGKVKVANAHIELKELPAGSVKVSEDEIIVGQEKSPEEEAVAAPVNINANIEVDLGKDTHFSGFGLETDLTGKLQIVQKDQKMRLHGNVDMKDATYKSYGQDLTVRKGRFLFNGPPDNPWLDVEAIRVSRDKKVTATLALSGSAKSPKTKIYSDPALPESEALAYLVTGRSMSQVSKDEGNMIAAAALSYGTGEMSWLADKLGIDEFEVKEGETLQDTLVAVGQYLNPDFYVGAKVGLFNNQTSLVLKRKLTESLNVETEAGVSQRIKLNYEVDKD
ncbi:MAG: translocation/assembly module TamB domain-containing protein, partial [Methylosarcina sp.]